MKEKGFTVLLSFTILIFLISSTMFSVGATFVEETGLSKEEWSHSSSIEVINPYFSIEHSTLNDGTHISAYIINGPPKPPPGYETERSASMITIETSTSLPNFPSYRWVFGCSAVSGAIIAAYYDHNGYPNMYAGPTNSGEMPLTDTFWSNWTDVNGDQYPNNPLVASHNGVDGRISRGSIDNYWVKYQSTDPDPYITHGWDEHAWSTAIGDFMKTSQSAYSNSDGSTKFYNYPTSNDQLTCADMEIYDIAHLDGTFGRKLFYEARGYTVTDCFNQKTDNQVGGGFSFIDYQAEINSGHPVFINLRGHSVVGFGYSGDNILIRDTWDSNPNNIYTMPWGGSYQGMELNSVSIVRLQQENTFNCNNAVDVSAEECNALVALYNATNGAEWENNDNWLDDNSINNWFGVTLSSGHVTTVDLGFNQLHGTLPSQLGNLSKLQVLWLDGNNLSGPIPIELGELADLVSLVISENQLTGSIPAELGNLSNLKSLWLNKNNLTGSIPIELGSLANLVSLDISENQFSSTIPIELSNLLNLNLLGLSRNELSGSIPVELGNLSNLVILNLSSNKLSGTIPSELDKLSNLEYLNLHSNQLSGSIPPSLGNLSNLHWFTLYLNQLSGSIPAELGKLSNLNYFILHSNQLNGPIPVEIGNLTNLRYFDLKANQLSGAIPQEFGDLANLEKLDLSQNKFTGQLPESFINLENLKDPGEYFDGTDGLKLSYNRLETSGLSQNLLDFLAIKDPDWYLTQAVEQTIPGETGGTLVSNDGNTEISIPPNAVDGDVNFTFVPQPSPAYDTGALVFAGNSFELTAQDALEDPITTFAQSIIITLHYDEVDLGDIPEENLFLYYWDEDGAAWVDVVTTCDSGTYTRNLEENWLSVPICHLSQFALMATEEVAENSAPVAENQSIEAIQDTPVQITLVASDPDGDSLTYIIVDEPDNGTLDFDPVDLPTLTYTPNPTWFGQDSFTFKANDGELDSNIATVTIKISEKEDVNTAPAAEDQSVETDQDTALQIILTATDPDGDPLTYEIVAGPSFGNLQYNPAELPVLTYTPNPGFFGPDSFTFKANDGELDSNIATVTITVTEKDEPSTSLIFLPLILK